MRKLSPPHLFCFIFLISILALSCKKTEIKSTAPQEKVEFPTTAKELRQVQINKDVASILEYVYQDEKAYYEVNAAIYSEYYDDETVMLRDLLFPETSPLYKTEKFKAYKPQEGLFKQRFYEALFQGEYPVLKEAMGLNKPGTAITNGTGRKLSPAEALSPAAAAPADTALEIYSNSSGSSIYFPYSENFGSNFTTAYFDRINTDPQAPKATIVAADRESNSAPGREPYICGTKDNMQLCYRTVTVDDAYAERKVTHIVGGGADIMCHNGCTPPVIAPGPLSQRVFIGWVRLYMPGNQPENFVSLSKANGGGSELKIGKASGYLKYENEQVTGFEDIITPDKKFKRKDVRKGRWRALYAVWEPDWIPADKELVLGVWEDDNRGEQTFTGSLKSTVRNATSGANAEGNLAYSIKVVSQDQIITNFKMDQYSYFRTAKFDQGSCGFLMTDDKGSRYDTYELPAGSSWPLWQCNTAFSWTWPYHTY